MKTYKLLSTLALCGLLTACGAPAGDQVAKSDLLRDTSPIVPSEDLDAVVRGNNDFAVDLYGALRLADGNLVSPPYSISTALAMTYAGARGDTESQMADAMDFYLRQENLHPAFNALDLKLESSPQTEPGAEQPLRLRIANAVWAERTYHFLPEFLDTLALNYGAGVRLADFVNSADASRKEINNWVSDETEGKINDLIPEGAIDALTRMVLVNAIYFKADWQAQFSPDSTWEAPFHLLDGSQVDVPTMHQGMFTRFAGGDDWQAIELPYAGETAAMVILVPDEGKFEQFESTLDAQTVSTILAGMEPTSVELALPKFEFTSEIGLADPLRSLGMRDAFDQGHADLSGMDGTRELYISAVLHKAFVAVDEEGTEAAAATGVIVGATGAPLFEVTLTVDRPFIFLIRDLETGQILFMGRVVNPAP